MDPQKESTHILRRFMQDWASPFYLDGWNLTATYDGDSGGWWLVAEHRNEDTLGWVRVEEFLPYDIWADSGHAHAFLDGLVDKMREETYKTENRRSPIGAVGQMMELGAELRRVGGTPVLVLWHDKGRSVMELDGLAFKIVDPPSAGALVDLLQDLPIIDTGGTT